MITAILTGYNRPQNIPLQVEALKNQTVMPEDVMLWYNKGNTPQIEVEGVKSVVCNYNFKFHGRFALALLAQTEYVAIFDDDTIPGPRWFESCLETMKTHEGILGSAGVKLNSTNYQNHVKYGCNGVKSNKPEQVDLVGHAWFFKRDWLRYFWTEYPITWENGEDIQLSFFAQKYGNIKTFVPPHPSDDKDSWGSINVNLGLDNKAHSLTNQKNHMVVRNELVGKCINDGWTLSKDMTLL